MSKTLVVAAVAAAVAALVVAAAGVVSFAIYVYVL